ncbi:hypothetical protein Tco_1141259 [Tanacetum coccineum]
MKEVLPSMVDSRVNEIAKKSVPLYVAKGLLLERQKNLADLAAMIVEAVQKECKNLRDEITLQVTNAIANSIPPTVVIHTRDHKDHHDNDAHPKGKSSVKRQKTSECATYSVGESSSEHAMDQELNPSGLGEIDEAQLHKVVNDMLRQRCNLGEEHQKERLSLPTLEKPTPVYHNCQRDPKAPPMILLNQDIFYLKYGNSGPKKYNLSLHKYLAVPFLADDIKE